MVDSSDEKFDDFEPPEASDGFHQPSKATKRRNYITAAVIGGIVFLWILLGLYRVLF